MERGRREESISYICFAYNFFCVSTLEGFIDYYCRPSCFECFDLARSSHHMVAIRYQGSPPRSHLLVLNLEHTRVSRKACCRERMFRGAETGIRCCCRCWAETTQRWRSCETSLRATFLHITAPRRRRDRRYDHRVSGAMTSRSAGWYIGRGSWMHGLLDAGGQTVVSLLASTGFVLWPLIVRCHEVWSLS
jgi:hypothetical protein